MRAGRGSAQPANDEILDPQGGAATLAEAAYRRLRQDIVAGGSKSANDRKVAALIARKRMAGTFHAYAGPPTATVSSHATVSAAKARAARMSSGANRG